MAANLDIIISATNKTKVVISGVKSDLADLERSAGSVAKGFAPISGAANTAFGIISKAAAATAIAVGVAATGMAVALTKFTTDGIDKAATLEEQMGSIAAVMSKTKGEVEPLKDLIMDLGIDPKLKVSTFEAADAIQMLARNGLNMSEIMDGAARSTVLLANATSADFGTAADIATDVMSIFNIEAADMSRAVDGITSVVNNSKFSIDDYRLAIAQGGGVAGAVGVEFDDFNTSIAATAANFASGSDAGTSFKIFLQRLVPDTGAAEDMMMRLGLMTEESGNAFFDASGNMKGMSEISGLLQKALAGLSEEQQNNALKVLFGTDAMRTAVGLAKVGKEGFDELKKTMGDTSAEDSAATRMDNYAGVLEILQGVIEGVQIAIGEKFLPVLRSLAERFTTLVGDNQDRIMSFFDGIAKWVEGNIPAIEETMVQWFEAVLIWANDKLPRALESLQNAFAYVRDVLIPLAKENIPALITVAQSLWDMISPMIETIRGWIKAFSDLDDGQRRLILTLGTVIVAIGPVSSAIAGLTGIIGAIVTISGGAVGALSGAGGVTFALGALLNPIGLVVAAVGGLAIAWTNDWGGIRTGTIQQVQYIGQTVNQLGQNVQSSLSSAMNSARNSWVSSWNGLVSEVGNAAYRLRDRASSAGRETADALTSGLDRGRSYFQMAISSLAGIVGSTFQSKRNDWITSGRDIAYGIRDGVSNQASSLYSSIRNLGTSMLSSFKSALGIRSPSTEFAEAGYNIAEGLATGIGSGTGIVDIALSSMIANVRGVLDKQAEYMDNWLRDQINKNQQAAQQAQSLQQQVFGLTQAQYAVYWQQLQGGASQAAALAAAQKIAPTGAGQNAAPPPAPGLTPQEQAQLAAQQAANAAREAMNNAISVALAPFTKTIVDLEKQIGNVKSAMEIVNKQNDSQANPLESNISVLKKTIQDLESQVKYGAPFGPAHDAAVAELASRKQELVIMENNLLNIRAKQQETIAPLLTRLDELTKALTQAKIDEAKASGASLVGTAAGRIKKLVADTLFRDVGEAESGLNSPTYSIAFERIGTMVNSYLNQSGKAGMGDSILNSLKSLINVNETTKLEDITGAFTSLFSLRNSITQVEQPQGWSPFGGTVQREGNTFNITFTGNVANKESILQDIAFLNALYGATP